MSTTTTLVLIGIGAIVLIVTGIKVSSSDKGDNFSITSMLLLTGILISMTLLVFLMIYQILNCLLLLLYIECPHQKRLLQHEHLRFVLISSLR